MAHIFILLFNFLNFVFLLKVRYLQNNIVENQVNIIYNMNIQNRNI